MDNPSDLGQRSPIPVNYVYNLVQLMVDSGIDQDQLLAEANLRHDEVFDNKEQLRFSQFRTVMLVGKRLSGDPALALTLGNKLMLTAHGLLGYAVISSSNLEQTMALLQRYFCTRTRLCVPIFRLTNDGGVLAFHEMLALGDMRETYLEVVMAAVVGAIRYVAGDDAANCRLEVPYSRPAHGARYSELLGMPVSFDKLALSLYLPRSLLQKPSPMADKASRRMATERCEQELQQLEANQDMEARVRQQLTQAEGHLPSVEELAERFYMTSRTLRRRLEACGTTYQKILDNVRHLRALRYLGTHHTIQQVAWLLGYADPSNFSRAFRKWEGMSPSKYLDAQATNRD